MTLSIGITRQLFFDDHVIESMTGLQRRVHPATKHQANPIMVPTGHETAIMIRTAVVYSHEKKCYQMWYAAGPQIREYLSVLNIAYATSTDGVHWEKPVLPTPTFYWKNRFEDLADEVLSPGQLNTGMADKARAYYRNNPSNIIFPQAECQGIVYMPDDPDPQQRYKGTIFGGTLVTSPDGIHWTMGNTFYPGQGGNFNYDEANHLYFCMFYGPPPIITAADGTWRRAVGFSCSHDLVHWSGSGPDDVRVAVPLTGAEIYAAYDQNARGMRGQTIPELEVVLAPDELDDQLAAQRGAIYRQTHGELGFWNDRDEFAHSNIHGMPVLPYENVYIGFPVKLDTICNDPHYGDDGPMYVELSFSRDLRHWQRFREPVVPNGPPGSWDGGSIDCANRPIIVGDEIWLYYGASAKTHGWPTEHPVYQPKDDHDRKKLDRVNKMITGPESGNGIARWRLDGFVSLHPDNGQGKLTTKPVVFAGRELEINADAAGGRIRVELQDQQGQPLPGYSFDDCDPLTDDSVHHVVTWRGQSDLTLLAGPPRKLCFEINDAHLFAFQFIYPGPSPQARAFVAAPHKHIDLQPPITVGPEITEPANPGWHSENLTNLPCARCGVVFARFDAARVFKSPDNPNELLRFHTNCCGNLRHQGDPDPA